MDPLIRRFITFQTLTPHVIFVSFFASVTSSEKADKAQRYADFTLLSVPYPGKKALKKSRSYLGIWIWPFFFIICISAINCQSLLCLGLDLHCRSKWPIPIQCLNHIIRFSSNRCKVPVDFVRIIININDARTLFFQRNYYSNNYYYARDWGLSIESCKSCICFSSLEKKNHILEELNLNENSPNCAHTIWITTCHLKDVVSMQP